jgi:hypothetical protein
MPSERAIILSFSYVYLSFYAGKNTTIFGTPPHILPFCRRNIENAWKKGKMCGGVPKIVVFLPA